MDGGGFGGLDVSISFLILPPTPVISKLARDTAWHKGLYLGMCRYS